MYSPSACKSSPLLFAAAALIFSSSLFALDLHRAQKGEVLAVTLKELRPTQAVLGFDQIYYKLGRFKRSLKTQLNEVCKTNGQQGVAQFSATSQADNARSFSCKAAVGTYRQEMKSVVIAPDDRLYLTDGHHTLNAFWNMENGGEGFVVHIVIKDDYRRLGSMAHFWKKMQAEKNSWLLDAKNTSISPDELPKSLGLTHFTDTPYRSLVYFSRSIAWQKPPSPVPFLEFYWAQILRKKIQLSSYDLTSQSGYLQAIKDSSEAILSLKDKNLSGSGKSVQEMGQIERFDNRAFKKLSRKQSKLNDMLAYKNGLDRLPPKDNIKEQPLSAQND